jgi:hypothetical protein
MRTRRGRGDDGSVAVEFPLAFAFMVIPVAMLMMLIPQWPERQNVARAAAQEAAVTAIRAPTFEQGQALAQARVIETAQNHGLSADALTLTWEGQWCRGCELTAVVEVKIPAIAVPFLEDDISVGESTWTARSTSRIDDYRSGV